MNDRVIYGLMESVEALTTEIIKLNKLIGEARPQYGDNTSLTDSIYELAVKVKRANPISKQIYTDIVNHKKNY